MRKLIAIALTLAGVGWAQQESPSLRIIVNSTNTQPGGLILQGIGRVDNVNIDPAGPGILNVGDGTRGHHNAELHTGTIGVGTAAPGSVGALTPATGFTTALDVKGPIRAQAGILSLETSNPTGDPTDFSALLYNKTSFGPVVSGFKFGVNTGGSGSTPTIRALTIDDTQNATFATNVNLGGRLLANGLASMEGSIPVGPNGSMFGFNVSAATGTYKALQSLNRSMYLEMGNGGMIFGLTPGTQSAGVNLSGTIVPLYINSGGTVGVGSPFYTGTMPLLVGSHGGFDATHEYSPITTLLGPDATNFPTVADYESHVFSGSRPIQESGVTCGAISPPGDANWQTGCFYGIVVNQSASHTFGGGGVTATFVAMNNVNGGNAWTINTDLKDYIRNDEATHKTSILKSWEADGHMADTGSDLTHINMNVEFRTGAGVTAATHGHTRGVSFDVIGTPGINTGYFDEGIYFNDYSAARALHIGRAPLYVGNNSSTIDFASAAGNVSKLYQSAAGAITLDNGAGGTLALDASGNVNASTLGSGNLCATGGTLFTAGCTGGGANSLTVDASHPLYLYAHFADTDAHTLRLSYSRDGKNWTPVSKTGVYDNSNDFRDPTIRYQNGMFCVLGTPNTGPVVSGHQYYTYVQKVCSTDLITWSYQSLSTLAPYIGTSTTTIWAPEWDVDDSGNVGFWIAASTAIDAGTNNTPNSFYPCWVGYDPWTDPFTITAATCLSGGLLNTSQGRTFDFFPWKVGSTHYLFYVDQQPVSSGSYTGAGFVSGVGSNVVQPIAYATSSSHHGGTYTQQTSPGTSWTSFISGNPTEAPALFTQPNGNIAAIIDSWSYPPQGGRHYTPWVFFGSSASVPSSLGSTYPSGPLRISRAEHGTVITITDQTVANIVYKAESNFASNSTIGWGGFRVNTNSLGLQAPYALTITAPLTASGGIQYPETATLGLDTGSPNNEIATLTPCGTYAQSCWTDRPGTARLIHNYQGDGAFGQTQFSNAQSDGRGEASLMLCDGCTPQSNTDVATWTNPGCSPGTSKPGIGPCPVSVLGDISIWTFGVNNQAIDLRANNQRFFLYNKGLSYFNGSTTIHGGFPLQVDPVTGEMRINYGITLGGGGQTTYGHDRYASIWSSGQNVVEIGDGTGPFSNHNGILKMGSAVVEYNNTTSTSVNSIISGLCTPFYCSQRNLWFETSGSLRWAFSVRSPESGSNSGSDFFLDRLNDSGGYLDTPFLISRASGIPTMTRLNLTSTPAASSGSKALCLQSGIFVVVSSSNVCPP